MADADLSVALVSPGWPAEAMPNGIVAYTAAMVKGLGERNVRCDVFAPGTGANAAGPFVHFFQPRDRPPLSTIMWRIDPLGWQRRTVCAGLIAEIKRLQTQRRIDVLELEESFGWASRLAGRVGVPLVVRLHGPWFLNGSANGAPPDRQFRRRDAWERAGLQDANAVTAPSNHVLEQTRAHFGLELPGAQVIPNPVEIVPPASRWKLEDCDRNQIAFIGRFDRHKGADTMLWAFRIVSEQNPDARLDFVGPDRGYVDDAGATWKMEQYLQEKLPASVRQNVTVHGFQPGAKAGEIRKRALVTVVPSRYETFGIAAAEAMMAGCPLVVCGAGALTELVQDGVNGLVARPADAPDVAAKVLSLMANPAHAAALGRQAANDAWQRYAPHVVADQTIAFYRRILGRGARAAAD